MYKIKLDLDENSSNAKSKTNIAKTTERECWKVKIKDMGNEEYLLVLSKK